MIDMEIVAAGNANNAWGRCVDSLLVLDSEIVHTTFVEQQRL